MAVPIRSDSLFLEKQTRGNEKRLRFAAFILSLKLIGAAWLTPYMAQQFVEADGRKFTRLIASSRRSAYQ